MPFTIWERIERIYFEIVWFFCGNRVFWQIVSISFIDPERIFCVSSQIKYLWPLHEFPIIFVERLRLRQTREFFTKWSQRTGKLSRGASASSTSTGCIQTKSCSCRSVHPKLWSEEVTKNVFRNLRKIFSRNSREFFILRCTSKKLALTAKKISMRRFSIRTVEALRIAMKV